MDRHPAPHAASSVPDPAGTTLPALGGTGGEGVLLDPGTFTGVLRALETVNHGRTLSVPKVLVNNNETATLDSLLQAPYATSNTSTNLATVSFGGTLDAGTSVQGGKWPPCATVAFIGADYRSESVFSSLGIFPVRDPKETRR